MENDGGAGCKICGSKLKWSIQYSVDARIEKEISADNTNLKYGWFLCRTCGNCYPTFVPSLSILAQLWEHNRDLSEADRGREEEIRRYRRMISEKGARRSYDFFSALYSGEVGRFIDIGCGLGETVKAFASHGWDALGVDADPNMKPFHNAIHINSRIGQIETLHFENKFDIIHTAHAIYFVTEVRTFIASLRELLTKDGLLCVVLANFLSSDDNSVPGYMHSFFPTESSMRYLLALEGFQVVASKKESGSIFMAARKIPGSLPAVYPLLIRFGFESKPLRYALFGRPLVALKSFVKRLLGVARPAS